MYDEAIKLYEDAANLIEKELTTYKFFKKDLIEKEAAIYSNIAACYKQGQHNKKEVEYCTKVIDRASYINDTSMLAKAYLGRGFAYENLEKYADAKEDILRVRQLQPDNIPA